MRSGGFLDRINQSPVHTTIVEKIGSELGGFRLPSEPEWEYAARGGPHWSDGFRFSGSDDSSVV